MSDAPHTLGPWAVKDYARPFTVVETVTGYGYRVCEVGPAEDNGFGEEDMANARLIAAAPDMLAAGRAVIAAWEHGDLAAAVRELSAAIAKATGETK